MVSDLFNTHDNSWNLGRLYSLFSEDDVVRIRSLRINVNKNDEIMWAHTKNGKYTVKSAYNAYMNDSIIPEDVSFWKRVWSLDCLPKIKFFIWNFFAYVLPVNSLLKFYNPAIDDCCPFCANEAETVMHLFVQCLIASHIWFALSLQHLISGDYNWLDDMYISWFDNNLGSSPYVVNWSSVGAVVLWSIWKLRCDVVFRKIKINLDSTIMDIRRSLHTYIVVPSKTNKVTMMKVNIPFQEVDHIIFVDGSFKKFNMSIGIVVCYNAGSIKGCRADFGLIHSVVAAETMTLILACSWVRELNLSNVLFVSDCLQLVQLVNEGKSDIDWRSLQFLEDYRSSFFSCVNSRLVYVKRDRNKITDGLARRARNFSLKNIWNPSPHFLQTSIGEVPLTEICNNLFT
ncbi:uncharacterized protein LOC113359740 [Papaver somniferum]|uniref:uncharacterized protein LOC113359740 n=1 Tax=Papaver somniferum TaxID=3469 RepID=UPI000E6FB68A|nr:uncharacterized protein LOC113359740 [Papaver somniferum]